MGLFEGEGTSCWDLNVFQYVCSGVSGEGPGGSLTGCRDVTGAAILAGLGNQVLVIVIESFLAVFNDRYV